MTTSYASRFPGVAAARRSGVTLADNGGGAQVPRETLDAVARFLELENTQKGRASRRKVRVLEMIEAARAAFAELIGVAAETCGFGLAERADHVTLYGRTTVENRLPVFAFNIRGETPDRVARHLDTHGIEANAGNFYSPRLMRTLVPASGAAVRFSYAHYIDNADVDQCFTAVIGATV